jgi:hypothetical protein
MKRINPAIKEKIIEEHLAGTGMSRNEFCLIRQVILDPTRFWLYWMDGEIERRDARVNGAA